MALATAASGTELYNLACALALASAAADDEGLPPAERHNQAQAHATRAVRLLGRCAASGHLCDPQTGATVRRDHDLDALRDRADFRTLLGQLPTDATAAAK